MIADVNGLNIVDSSGWIEYFADGPNAGRFAGPLSDPDRLVVPTVTVYRSSGSCCAGAARAMRLVPLPP